MIFLYSASKKRSVEVWTLGLSQHEDTDQASPLGHEKYFFCFSSHQRPPLILVPPLNIFVFYIFQHIIKCINLCKKKSKKDHNIMSLKGIVSTTTILNIMQCEFAQFFQSWASNSWGSSLRQLSYKTPFHIPLPALHIQLSNVYTFYAKCPLQRILDE